MSAPLTPLELRLAAQLLANAADAFSSHGCNDFDLSDIATPAERAELRRKMHEYNGDPEEFASFRNPDAPMFQDWCLMSYLSERIKEQGD